MDRKWLILAVLGLLLLALIFVYAPQPAPPVKDSKQTLPEANNTPNTNTPDTSNESSGSDGNKTQAPASPNEPAEKPPPASNPVQIRSATVANWNLQIFGTKKAANATLMDAYARILDQYDVVFVQEIRDNSGGAFRSLCARIPTHQCENSSRAGRTNSKEQVGIIYRKGIQLVELKDFNPDEKDRWERPPIEAVFDIEGYRLKAYNAHLDPDSVVAELAALEQVVNSGGNVAVLGDFNADCRYYPQANRTQFRNWTWVIPDGEDTTVHATNCTYDRILLNADAAKELAGYGVYRTGINATLSDHYLIWMNLTIGDG